MDKAEASYLVQIHLEILATAIHELAMTFQEYGVKRRCYFDDAEHNISSLSI
jgi:hypothetical protein